MESQQAFLPADYSLRTEDLIPDDDFDFEDNDSQWMDYLAEAAKVNRTDILQAVLSDLDAEDSPLYDLIDKAIEEPFVPGERPRENIMVLAKLGQAILTMVAKAVDDAVGLRMAVQEVR